MLRSKDIGLLAIGGSQASLRRAWLQNNLLVDKAMKSHSKCDECVRYSSLLAGMVGKVDEASNANRAAIRELSSNHMLEMGARVRTDNDDSVKAEQRADQSLSLCNERADPARLPRPSSARAPYQTGTPYSSAGAPAPQQSSRRPEVICVALEPITPLLVLFLLPRQHRALHCHELQALLCVQVTDKVTVALSTATFSGIVQKNAYFERASSRSS